MESSVNRMGLIVGCALNHTTISGWTVNLIKNNRSDNDRNGHHRRNHKQRQWMRAQVNPTERCRSAYLNRFVCDYIEASEVGQSEMKRRQRETGCSRSGKSLIGLFFFFHCIFCFCYARFFGQSAFFSGLHTKSLHHKSII